MTSTQSKASASSNLSAALPYTLTTPPTTTQSIIIRRVTAVGTAAALLYLLPLPYPSNLLSTLPIFTTHPYFSQLPPLLDGILTNLLYLLTLTFSYHLALHTTPIAFNGKSVPTQWLMPAASAIVGLAAAAEDTWVRTNILWDIVLVFWVSGWKVMSFGERERLSKWAGRVVIGMVAERVSREFLGKKE